MTQPTPLSHYRSPRSRGRAAIIVLWIVLAFDALALLIQGYFLLATPSVWDRNQALVAISDFISAQALLSLVVAAVLVCRWFHMVYGNLPPLGQQIITMSPGRAVAGFFIPVLALWEPYQAMTEIWAVSNSPLVEEGKPIQGTPPRIAWWWVPYIAAGILGYWAGSLKSPADQGVASALWVGNHGLRLVSGMVLIGLIKEISRRQDYKAGLLTQRSTDDRPYRAAGNQVS